jgi:hypothetical protein
MKSQNETSDPAVLKRYNPRAKMTPENERGLCPYCNKPKKRMGKMFVCTCTGKQIYTPNGLSVKKHLKFTP